MSFLYRRTWADGRRKIPLQRRISNRWWWCIFWSVLCLSWSETQASGVIVASYTTPNETVVFQHVAVDSLSGRVYVGATNWLFQLSSGLELDRAVQTGPVEDNIQCFPGACSEQQVSFVDNVNKILVVDEVSRRLLVCGSVYQGSCQRRELEDIAVADELVPLPVAANDETSSTVAFVGPARYMGYPSRVLYVATTNSKLGPYRDMVPAICSRHLEDDQRLFGIIEKSFSEILRVDISSQVRDYYLVNYIYGFHSGDYVYFATLQRRSHLRSMEEGGYISRLARICVSDARYDSYVETTLQCLGPDGRDYNLLQDAHIVRTEPADLLVGVFAASRDHTVHSSGRSAVCVFSLADVEQRFTENIHLCYNGSVSSRDMDYIAGSIQECPEPGVREAILSNLLNSQGGNIFNFCGESLKLNGSLPLTSFPVITYENMTLSSVVATTTSHHIVAFIGTRSGLLKKVLIGDEAEEFEEVVVDEGNPILPDMHLDPTETHIYAASPYKISKVRIEECNKYEACDQCLRARNPYCGWCSLEKRCTVKAACQNATLTTDSSSPRWLSLNTQQCIDFQAIRPEHLPRNSLSVVELVINQLPQLPYGAHYMCVFGSSTPVQAKVTDQGLACLAPVLAERPPIPKGKDHVSVDLAVRSSETNKDFLNRLFAFYDCTVHKTCTSCVTSSWACSWCPHENKCTHNVTTCSRTVISGENNPQNSLIKGRQHCPSFKLEEEILLPSGMPKEITIEVRNLPSVVENFQCVIEIEGAKERVLAIAKNNKIICSETASCCRTGASAGPMAAEVVVGNKAGLTLANERFFYKVVELSRVHPNKGPQSGGTRLYLIGANLNVGSQLQVLLDDIPCEVDRTLASNSQISCRTTKSPIPSYNVSLLRLSVDNALLTLPNPFVYRDDPIVKKITPLKSFVSGGRAVTVSGVNFLPVQQPRMVVYFNDSLVNETICEVRSDHLMVCPSPSVSGSASKWQLAQADYMAEESSDHLLKLRIGFIMDGVESVRSLQDSFPSLHSDLTYVSDPKFFSFEEDAIKLYKGESLVIEGENLRLASTESEVNVTIGTRPCNLTSLASTQLVCVPPEVQPAGTDEIGRRTESGLPMVVALLKLQTDMTDLTNDLENAASTLDIGTIRGKVFFPGVYDHPLLQETKLRQNGMYSTCEVAMAQFEQLINNKCFLLTFIKTLEVQKSFSFRDRVNVASLLMVILLEKMEYATE
ncbi:Plexin-B like protein [Argiope bruennichi]|uniref:Plexin-B like protein n=1 Tax=Argiope bruennichi TaxID=94029 RepID=A0A8T0FV60_ARGBR|nr:Plexin-B like protein [Argiope bruennichi]